MRGCVGATTSLAEPRNCRHNLEPAQATRLDEALAAVEHQMTAQLPVECETYAKLVGTAKTCEALPSDIRADLVRRLSARQAVWNTMDDKTSLAGECSGAITALRGAAPSCFKK